MQGTGTQVDPYIPTTWNEFVTAIGTSGAYVELPEGGGVFDMDEIAPEGGFSVNISCISLSGNNWEIRNANNVTFTALTSDKIIDNLHFLKFNAAMFEFYYNTVTRCKFSGVYSTSSSPFYKGIFRRCSLNLKCFDNALNHADGSNFYFSRIMLDQSDSLSTASPNTNIGYYNCFLEHKANANGKQLYLNGTTSILHSDAGNYIKTPSGTKVGVTEDQLKNAAYLRSVGFPIVGG